MLLTVEEVVEMDVNNFFPLLQHIPADSFGHFSALQYYNIIILIIKINGMSKAINPRRLGSESSA